MNAKDKRRFIRELCNTVKNEALANVARMPEDWDGHELRALVAAKFADANMGACAPGRRGDLHRRRAFENECLIRNL